MQSDHSLSFQPEEMLDPWLSIEHPLKTQTRLCRCTVWSESSINSHTFLVPFAGHRLKYYDTIKCSLTLTPCLINIRTSLKCMAPCQMNSYIMTI